MVGHQPNKVFFKF